MPATTPRHTARLGWALLLAASVASRASAQAPTPWQPAAGHPEIPLWPGTPPNARTDLGPETAAVVTDSLGRPRLVGGKPWTYVANVSRPTITVYAPKRWPKASDGAAVVVYPGGGFNVLAMDLEGTEACDWLTGLGVSCILLKYRVPCELVGAYRECPPAHQDAQRAIRLARARAREWHLDPNRIGVMGFSAGAHMAIMSSTRFASLYSPVDSADSLSSRPDFALVLYPGRVAYRQTNFAPNPDINVTGRTPPTFLVQAYDDDLNPVENTLLYASALHRAGVPAEVRVFATGGHAFGLRRTGAPTTAWPQLAAAWLRSIGVLRESSASRSRVGGPRTSSIQR